MSEVWSNTVATLDWRAEIKRHSGEMYTQFVDCTSEYTTGMVAITDHPIRFPKRLYFFN